MADPAQVNTDDAFDYASLVIADSPPTLDTPAETPEDKTAEDPPDEGTEAASAEQVDGAAQTDDEAAAEKDEKTPETKPGTPDKERQRYDQKLASVDQRLEKLLSVVEKQGGSATPDQVEQARSLKDERDELAALLDEKWETDPYTDQKTIAKRLLSTEKKHGDELAAVRAELAELRTQNSEARAEQTWTQQERKYEGVKVRDVWKTAVKDAATELKTEHEKAGITLDQTTIEKLCAARSIALYEKRADEAAKSVKARQPAPKNPQSPTNPAARQPPPKTTPGGARVLIGNRSPSGASVDPNAITMADYRGLIKSD